MLVRANQPTYFHSHLKNVLEQGRAVSHLEQLLLGVLCLGLLGDQCLALVLRLVAPLEKQSDNHAAGAKGQAETETSVVLGLLGLEVHEGADDTSNVADAVHQGDTNGAAGRGGNVVGVPGGGGGLDGVDTNDGEDDGEICDAHLFLEGAVEGDDNGVGDCDDGHGGDDEGHAPEEAVRDLGEADGRDGGGDVGGCRGQLGVCGAEAHGLGDGGKGELDAWVCQYTVAE